MVSVGETDGVANPAVRKQSTASPEASLHRSPEYHHRGHAPPAPQEQNGRREVLPTAAVRDSCSANGGPKIPDLQTTGPRALDLQATDQRSPDFCTTTLQITEQQQEYKFCATYDPHATNRYADDFFAVITPNASDDFDAVDLTGDDYDRKRSVDFGSWEGRAPIDLAQAQSLEDETWRTSVQAAVNARKVKDSLWTRLKKYISRGLCFHKH